MCPSSPPPPPPLLSLPGFRAVRGSRRERGRALEALGAALQHHAEVPRRRPHEAQEAAAAMGGARGVARARGLDHVVQVGGALRRR